MAVRLPLHRSQPPRRDSAATDVTGTAEAMLASGIDANLIGGLDAIAAGSTDHLCLQGNNAAWRDGAWLPWSEMPSRMAASGVSAADPVDVSPDGTR
ncbi:MAG: hypothetical protein U0892_05100 [Pirellulales bacterium]